MNLNSLNWNSLSVIFFTTMLAFVIEAIIVAVVAACQADIQKQKMNTPKQNVEMTLEEAREIKAADLLQENIKSLHDEISNRIEGLTEGNANLVDFYSKRYKNLINFKIVDEIDLDYIRYLYNNGELRTPKEIKIAKKDYKIYKDEKIRESKEFKAGYHPVLAYLFPFLSIPMLCAHFVGENFFVGGHFILAFAFIPYSIISGIVYLIYVMAYNNVWGLSTDKKAVAEGVAFVASSTASYHISKKVTNARLDKGKYKQI